MRRISFIAFAISLLSGCGSKCLKGHYEAVDVPGHFETWHPPSKEQVWKCNQYEVEKGPATKK
jgi:hypothetical protein